ncbi:MAG: hypothetical protein IPO48_06705, partial [Saprospiraceae bacterium]|nr:hypothetical protein [Saprospiraceae bacterium]
WFECKYKIATGKISIIDPVSGSTLLTAGVTLPQNLKQMRGLAYSATDWTDS